MDVVIPRVLKLVLEDDTCPIDVWLQSLRDKTTRARVVRQIDRMERGNFGDHKDVGKGVSELRLFFGAAYRVYYAVTDNAIVVLLGGSDKSAQSAAISRAQQLWADFLQQGASEAALQNWSEVEVTKVSDDEAEQASQQQETDISELEKEEPTDETQNV